MQKGGGGGGGEEGGGSRTRASLAEQEVGVLRGSRSPGPGSQLRGARRRSRRVPSGAAQPAGPAAPAEPWAGSRGCCCGSPHWVSYLGFFPPSPYGANSLLCSGTQTYYIARSLLPLKPGKLYFPNSGEKRGGGEKVLA